MKNQDTICAIVTPPGIGGVGIVRVSGTNAREVLKKIWKGKNQVSCFESHKMYLGLVCDPCKKISVDSVLAVIMPKPHSYTGEDVVEISCHGGPVILDRVLSLCLNSGSRLAEPGEFTKQAFLNGKMDLAQAEAVADIISATNEKAARLALSQLEGGLSNRIGKITEELNDLRAFVEATIDFPEEDVEFIKNKGIANKLEHILKNLKKISKTYYDGRVIKDGVKVAIVGKPNVGKSSLFNALIGTERAIVHHDSGTTRDLITETVLINGISFHLTDAAGFRDNGHDVEMIGIKKAKEFISKVDKIILVVDASSCDAVDDVNINPENTILCINKTDLISFPKKILSKIKYRKWSYVVYVSVKMKSGLVLLKKVLVDSVKGKKDLAEQEGVVITSARHKNAMDHAIDQIENALKLVENKESPEFIAEYLTQAGFYLGNITGQTTTDDILNRIFSKFCIGK